MSQRGRACGCCPGCKAKYFNRTKPPNCNMCGFALGGGGGVRTLEKENEIFSTSSRSKVQEYI